MRRPGCRFRSITTVSNIHGTGQKYRYCFEDKRVRF